MNPPFNIDSKTKEYIKANYCGRPLLPEVWFQKALELFGTSVPIAMFTPYGFRLTQTDNSSRWKKFIEGEYPEITSIVSFTKDVFDGILFHSQVLIFNLTALKGQDRKSVVKGKRVVVRVGIGGRRLIQKKKKKTI